MRDTPEWLKEEEKKCDRNNLLILGTFCVFCVSVGWFWSGGNILATALALIIGVGMSAILFGSRHDHSGPF